MDILPPELILDHLLPVLPTRDLLAFSQADRRIYEIANDNVLWRRKISKDFNLPTLVTAREEGWKHLYSALRRPTTYVWGATGNSRLGMPRSSPALHAFHNSWEGVNLPVALPLDPTVGLVDIAAGGYSFAAIDSRGKVWVWGTLDGGRFSYSRRNDPNWLDSGCPADQPREVLIPTRVETVSLGRRHVLLLDEAHRIYELTAWGKVEERAVPDMSETDRTVQVDAGWAHSAALSSQGLVTVWFPNFLPDGQFYAQDAPHSPATANPSQIIPVITQADNDRSSLLPPLPSGDKIVKIACGDCFLVALTAAGDVWTAWIGGAISEIGLMRQGDSRRVWEQHPRFSAPPGSTISHVSATFETFFAYSSGSSADGFASSVVYQGSKDDLRSDPAGTGAEPKVISALQGKGVIKVAVGDYHFIALTSTGKVFTWGQYSDGALGQGDLRDVQEPTELSFGQDKFAFAVTASGWHTGALVVDLAPKVGVSAASSSKTPVKLAPTPSHPTLPDLPPTDAFRNISNPPASGRPWPGVPINRPSISPPGPTPPGGMKPPMVYWPHGGSRAQPASPPEMAQPSPTEASSSGTGGLDGEGGADAGEGEPDVRLAGGGRQFTSGISRFRIGLAGARGRGGIFDRGGFGRGGPPHTGGDPQNM